MEGVADLGPGRSDVPGRLLLAFRVVGEPRPQGSKRILPTRDGRHVLVEHADGKLKRWRRAVVHAAAQAMNANWEPFDGPVILVARFYFERPKSHLKKAGGLRKGVAAAKLSAPDLSKLVRAIEDAMTDAGVWSDDCRVVGYTETGKEYGDPPGAMIAVYEWRPEEDGDL